MLDRKGIIYRVSQCARCELVQVHPRPTPEYLEDLYTDSYSKGVPNRRAIKSYQKTLRTIWKLITHPSLTEKALERRARPRLLDIGCNLGFFLREAARLGFVAEGIDVSQAAVNFVNKSSVASARMATVEKYAEWGEGEFEVVTTFDVIEHVANPRTFLDAACDLVRAGGMLVIGTPNVDSLFARLNFGEWYYADPPFHMNYFGRNLINFVEIRGFRLVKPSYAFAPSSITRYLPPKWEILEKGRPRCVADLQSCDSQKVSARRQAVELCFDALNFATSWLRIGDTMVLYFRKIVSRNEESTEGRWRAGVRI